MAEGRGGQWNRKALCFTAVGLPLTGFLRACGGGVNLLAVVDRKQNAGKVFHGMVIRDDLFLLDISEPFDLVIASMHYVEIYKRLQIERKLKNPYLSEIYAENFYKWPPPFGTDALIEDKQWEWLHRHFAGDYAQHIIELFRKNRGNPDAEPWLKISEIWDYASSEDYWKSVEGKNYHDKAVIIDCGAYLGDSIDVLVKAVKNPVEAYYALEPIKENFEKLIAHPLTGIKAFYPINKAVGAKNEITMAVFDAKNPEISSLAENEKGGSQREIAVMKLDSLDLHEAEDADIYIKMDIEGSELAALHGAERLIREKRPNLAICLYHKTNDIFEIPQYIDSLGLKYEFYLSGGTHAIMIAVPTADEA